MNILIVAILYKGHAIAIPSYLLLRYMLHGATILPQ
jgi:hypothetical protein